MIKYLRFLMSNQCRNIYVQNSGMTLETFSKFCLDQSRNMTLSKEITLKAIEIKKQIGVALEMENKRM